MVIIIITHQTCKTKGPSAPVKLARPFPVPNFALKSLFIDFKIRSSPYKTLTGNETLVFLYTRMFIVLCFWEGRGCIVVHGNIDEWRRDVRHHAFDIGAGFCPGVEGSFSHQPSTPTPPYPTRARCPPPAQKLYHLLQCCSRQRKDWTTSRARVVLIWPSLSREKSESPRGYPVPAFLGTLHPNWPSRLLLVWIDTLSCAMKP